MDPLGVIFVCAAIICYSLAMRWAGVEKVWTSSNVVGTLAGTVAFVAAFAVNQWHQGERATLLPNLLRNRDLVVGAIFEFL